MVAAEQETVLPEVIARVLAIKSAELVPAVPWKQTVPPAWVRMRKKASVSVASADESEVIAAKVPSALGAASVFDVKTEALQVSVKSRDEPAAEASASAGTAASSS
mgnify:CR=1 FL=1